MFKNSVFALFVLIGTIVGAGLFGFPYVVSKSGIFPALFYFLALGGIMIFLHLAFGEIFLRTKENCRLAGLARKYLGRNYARLTTASVVVGLMGSLLAYMILAGNFLSILLSSIISVDPFYCAIFFALIFIPFIFKGIKAVAPLEIFTNILFFVIIFFIFVLGLPKINIHNFTAINIPNIFLPYGVVLFSLVGFSAIPEAESILKTKTEKKKLKGLIWLAFLIVIIFYILFSFLVVVVKILQKMFLAG